MSSENKNKGDEYWFELVVQVKTDLQRNGLFETIINGGTKELAGLTGKTALELNTLGIMGIGKLVDEQFGGLGIAKGFVAGALFAWAGEETMKMQKKN